MKNINIKRKISILLMVAGIACFNSCKKDLLNLNPLDQLSSGTFWKTPADADLALAGLYSNLYSDGNTYACDQYAMYMWDNFTDNSYSHDDYGGSFSVGNGTLNATSAGYPYAYYANTYSSIARVNTFLARVGGTGVTGDNLNNYLGQAHLLRGFFYYNLGILYGAVPVTLDDPTSTSASIGKKAKSTKDDVLKQSASDLDSAIMLLPDLPYTDGHVVKGTALGLKLRLLMYQHDYANALPIAQQIITSAKFSLNTVYRNNFIKPEQSASTENMFSVKFQNPNKSHVDPCVGQLLLEWLEVLGTQNLIDDYECTDGKSITTSPLYKPTDPYSNRDPRMRMTFFFPGDGAAEGYPGGTFTGNSAPRDKSFYPPKKFINNGLSSIPTYGFKDDQDYVLLRYAEVLLLATEAENELNHTSDAYQYINLIRERAGMPDITPGLSQSDMRTTIRHEFRIEFALEGNRYFDLRRWGTAAQTLNGFVRDPANPAVKMVYIDKFNLWPIPQTDIDRNAPDLKQTDGY